MDPWQSLLHLLARLNSTPTGPDTKIRLVFELFPEGGLGLLVTLGLVALVLIGFFSFRGLALSARPGPRLLVRLLRAAALLIPALVLLGPSLVTVKEKSLPGTTVVLVDTSWSMRRADPDSPLTRAALVDRLMQADKGAFLTTLSARNRLEVFAFDTECRPLVLGDKGWRPLDPRGQATNLTAAVRRVLEEERAGRVAAAVLVTDGRWNEGSSPAEIVRQLKSRHIPLHIVGVGDATPRDTVRIASWTGPERAFAKDPFDLEVEVQGPPRIGDIRVELWDTLLGEEGKRIAERTLRADGEGHARTTFKVEPAKAGVHSYRVSVLPAGASEALEAASSLVVEVAARPAKVLLIAGSPTWEYRALRKLFTRDQTVDLSCWLQSADSKYPQQGNSPLKELPRTTEALRPFHTVIMVDPDPTGLDLLLAKNLEKAVQDEGTGFAYIAGEKFSLDFFNTTVRADITGPLAGILPARPDQSIAKIHVGVSRILKRAWPLEVTAEGSRDRLLGLGGRPERTRALFRALPGFYWNYPFKNPAPGAHVLAVHPGPDTMHLSRTGARPLLAWHHSGAGRVFLAALDETWRWRSVAEKTWDRFWVRTVRFLAEGKLLGDRTLHRLVTDRRSYEVGTEITLVDKLPLGAKVDQVEAKIKRAGKATGELKLARDPEYRAGLVGRFTPTIPGLYEVSIPGLEKAQKARFEVREPDQEDRGPLAEKPLKELAVIGGGTYTPLAGAAEIPSKIEEATEVLITESRPHPLWDNLAMLLVATLLLALEWLLRKWMNLP